MKNLPLFFLLFFAFFTQNLAAQCPPGQVKFRLEVDPDDEYYDDYWGVVDPETFEEFEAGFLESANLKTFEFCAPDTACLLFYMYDKSGDGFSGGGFFRIFLNDTLFYENLGDFGAYKTLRFNCPPGSFCDNAFDAQLGATTTPDGRETWYNFTPSETGTYEISTCDTANACTSKIWVYDLCEGLFVAGNQAGAIFFSEGGCPNGAVASVYLAAGKKYFVRMRYRYIDCPRDKPIHFKIEFKGAVQGCTDPAACNFNPLATISDTCIYNGTPCLRLPDLVTDEDQLRKTMQLELVSNGDDCAVEEGCIRGFGDRHLITFDTRISNVGTEDFYVGSPPASPTDTSSQFVYDHCHQHWHYRGYAEYLLFDNLGNAVPIGQKNGFCVLDLECYDGTFGKYTCENMGITKNCGDVYDHTLPCQWIDITGLGAGFYTFVARVNWDRRPDKNGRLELGYENNWAQACFELKYDGLTPEIEQAQQCPKYTDCAGVVFGNTQKDCEGKCGGSALRGDFDKNAVRNDTDRQAYLDAALADNADISTCNDLFEDGKIDVFDAALLQECTIHANDQAHWGNRYPCSFPTGTENPNDNVLLSIGTVDTAAKTVILKIANPNQRLLGYEFRVSGLEIESVENMILNFSPHLQFDNTGEIIALSFDEKTLKKNGLPTNFLKIKYKKLTAAKICIEEITAVVNEKYQKSNAEIGSPNCSGTVAAGEPETVAFGVFVIPNPFSRRAEVFFENQSNEEFSAVLTNTQGRVVQNFPKMRGESFVIENENLPEGIYFLTLRSGWGSRTVKVAVAF